MANNDIYGLLQSGLSPEIAAQAMGISQQQRIADALTQNGLTPLGGARSAGKYMVAPSWTEGLAKLAQVGAGQYMSNKGNQQYQDLAAKNQANVADALSGYNRTAMGQPGGMVAPATQNDDEGNANPSVNMPAVAGDPRKAIADAMLNPYLRNSPVVQSDMQLQKAKDLAAYTHSLPKAPEAFTLNPGDVRYGPDGKIMQTAPDKRIPPMVEHNFPVKDNMVQPHLSLDGGKTWSPIPGSVPSAKFAKQLGTTVNMPQPITPVTIQDPKNPNATIIIDGRTQKVLGAGPKLTQTGTANFKQATAMQGIAGDLQKAEDLLMGNTRDSEGNVTSGNKPTASGIGSLMDSTAGLIGVSPKGAAEANSLKVVAGKLVQKVPRFEGPQSDKDVALYKEMAGDAGNDKLPLERRLASIRTMRELYSGYEDGSRGKLVQQQVGATSKPITPAATGGAQVLKFDAQGNPI